MPVTAFEASEVNSLCQPDPPSEMVSFASHMEGKVWRLVATGEKALQRDLPGLNLAPSNLQRKSSMVLSVRAAVAAGPMKLTGCPSSWDLVSCQSFGAT